MAGVLGGLQLLKYLAAGQLDGLFCGGLCFFLGSERLLGVARAQVFSLLLLYRFALPATRHQLIIRGLALIGSSIAAIFPI